MHRPKLPASAVAVTLAMLTTTGEHAVAQYASELEVQLQAGAAMSSRVGTLPLGAVALTPAFHFSDPRLSISARGSAWLDGQQWQIGDAAVSIGAYSPLLYSVRAEVIANASRLYFDATAQDNQVDAQGRLHFMRRRGGVWLGSGVARPLHVATVSNVNVNSGGAWTKLGPATLRGSVTSFYFTKVMAGDTTEGSACPVLTALNAPLPLNGLRDAGTSMPVATATCRRESRLTDLEGNIFWAHRLIEVTLRGGQRFGSSIDVAPDSRRWASAQAAIWITDHVATVAGGGREPAQPMRGMPSRTYGTLGFMLAYWPIPRGTVPVETPASMVDAFELRHAGPSRQRITARIGGVETVEIMGDFTDWNPIPLIRRGRDQWELLVPMAAGVHQINMRIDGGEWIAPPGMPSMRDSFNGEVGVIVIRP